MSRIKRSLDKNSPSYKNIFLFILCLGLFLNPFVYWPAGKIAFEIPKVWFVQRFIEILGLTALLTAPFFIKKENLRGNILTSAIIFFFIVLISSFLGVNPTKSFWGNYYRGDGIFTLSHLFILFFTTALFFKKEFIKPVFLSISLASILISVWSLINAVNFYIFKIPSIFVWEEGIGVNFGNPNFLAGYLVVTLPFIKYFYDREKNNIKSMAFIGLIIQVGAVLLTKAWAGIFGIIIFFLMVFFFTKHKKYIPLLAIIFLLILSALFFTRYTKSLQSPGVIIAESRERIIKKGLLAFAEKPIMGWGWANFDYAFDAVVWPVKYKPDAYVDKAHSHLLEILVTTGLTGFFAYTFLLFQTGKNLLKSKTKETYYILLFFILFILHTQTNVISISEELLFWLFAGVSAKRFS